MKRIILTLFCIFLGTLCCFADEVGVGLKIYKTKPSNLKMSPLITDIISNSPADKAKMKTDKYIVMIDDIPTASLSSDECLYMLNMPKKNIKLTVTDTEHRNQTVHNIKPKKGFASERGYATYTLRKFTQNKLYPEFVKSNSLEELLTFFFGTHALDYQWSEDLTIREIFEKDWKTINDLYLKFKNNKNDMLANQYLYKGAITFSNQYAEVEKWEKEDLIAIVNSYNSNNFKSYEDAIAYVKSLNIKNKQRFLDCINVRENYSKKYAVIAKEIYDYSLAYEKQQQAKLQASSAYFVDKTDFRDILWGAKTPQKNGLYVIGFQGVKVLQTVSGGILASYHSDTFRTNTTIFIATKRQFADDTYIRNAMYLAFEGYYSYQNALGSNRKIYKFREIPQGEYSRLAFPPQRYFLED